MSNNWPEKQHIDPNNLVGVKFVDSLVSPHSQAWSIPEESNLEELPVMLTNKQLEATTLLVWKEYMLHDEVLSAISFLENAPYRIRYNLNILEALERTKKSIEWMNNRSTSEATNTPMDPNGLPYTNEVTNALPLPLNGQVEGRFSWITKRLPPPNSYKTSIIDFGCIDGTMSNRWGLEGYKVTGIDLSTNSCNIANFKAAEFGTNSVHINCYFHEAPSKVVQGSYDVATCSDAYEHLKDPVNDLLIHARKCIKGNGKMLLVTPHGSWMRGKYVHWAAPWTWIKQNGSWTSPQPRAHLVAPSVWSVANDFRKAGWWVKTSEVVLQNMPDVEGQGNICVEAYPTPPPVYPDLKISIVTSKPSPKSEKLAEDLAILGHQVTHYSSWKEESVCNFVDRMFYEKHKFLKSCDILIKDDDDSCLHVKVNSRYYFYSDDLPMDPRLIVKFK